jgi:hypothetical protein
LPFVINGLLGIGHQRLADPARGDYSLASAEGRPAFQEADHLLDSALARSMAAAVGFSGILLLDAFFLVDLR